MATAPLVRAYRGATSCIRASHKQTSCIFIISSASSPPRDLIESVRRWCHFFSIRIAGRKVKFSRRYDWFAGSGDEGEWRNVGTRGTQAGETGDPCSPQIPPQSKICRGEEGSQRTANASSQQQRSAVDWCCEGTQNPAVNRGKVADRRSQFFSAESSCGLCFLVLWRTQYGVAK
jgi:hypothetical protein